MTSGKLESDSFKKLLTPSLLKLERLFVDNGYHLRLVGGVVRDLLLGKAPSDVDLATECTPKDMIRLFETRGIRYIPTGLEHGTITVHIGDKGTDYEITTLRVDRETDGRRAVVDFTTDWRLDAERRDLTINAMSLDFAGTLYDYFNGQEHLAQKKVLFVGDASSRIKEDYLRILRYFRFYGRIAPLPEQHDAEILKAISSLAHGLKDVSVERIWMEMRRIVTGGHAPHLIKMLYSTGVARYIGLPENGLEEESEAIKEFERVWMEHQHHPLEPVTLLTALSSTPAQAHALTVAWKMSTVERRLSTLVASNRSEAQDPSTPIKTYQDLLVDGVQCWMVVQLLRYAGQHCKAEEIEKFVVPTFPVNGSHLKALGLNPGPEYGPILHMLRQKWKEDYYITSKEQLLEIVSKTGNQT
jgi:tRNA nucleotidyltransferase (CCA-adding enzyme)